MCDRSDKVLILRICKELPQVNEEKKDTVNTTMRKSFKRKDIYAVNRHTKSAQYH